MLAAPQASNVRLPLSFIIVGIVSFFAANVMFWLVGDNLFLYGYRSPLIWSMSHLFIIGWATMVAMGAMYQLVPVAFQIKIFSERLGMLQFYLMLIALLGFLYAFVVFNPKLLVTFGVSLGLGFLLFLLNMFLSMRRVKAWNVIASFVTSALLCLSLTVLFGILLVWNLAAGIFTVDLHRAVLFSHITLGTIGWFSLLIIGFSYKMIPMFALSHGYQMELAKLVSLFLHLGLVSIIVSYFFNSLLLLFAGVIFLFVAMIIFAYHVRQILQKAMKKHLDIGFRNALYAILYGILSTLCFAVFINWDSIYLLNQTNLLISSYYLFFMGWISLSILGYLYKIVPFLWWTASYSNKIGKKQVPTLKEMMNEGVGRWIFHSFSIGVVLVTLALVNHSGFLFLLGQGIVVLSSFAYMAVILLIFKKH